jgi:hypothetical protein
MNGKEIHLYEKFEYTKGVIRRLKSKNDKQYNDQKKKDKRTNNDLQKLHRKLKTEQQKPNWKPWVNACAPEGLAVPAPLVTPLTYIYK